MFYSKGIEDVAVENSLEENIAVVSFGNETRVVQNLTNDYSKIRDAVGKGTPKWRFVMASKFYISELSFFWLPWFLIFNISESLVPGGPSPIMTGLVLCMSAIYNRGKE